MGGGAKGGKVIGALNAARPRRGEEQVKARSRLTDNQLQSTLLTLGGTLGPVDSCGTRVISCVIQCVTFQSNSNLLISNWNSAVGELIQESGGEFVPAQTRRFSPSRAGPGAVGCGAPGLADGANGELETGALRAQGSARRPLSCLLPHAGSKGLWLK